MNQQTGEAQNPTEKALREELEKLRRTRDALNESLREFQQVQQLSETIRAALDPEVVVDSLVKVISGLIDFRSAGIFLLDHNNETKAYGRPGVEIRRVVTSFVEEGIIKWVIQEHRAVLIPDLEGAAVSGGNGDAEMPLNFVIAPLIIAGKGIGFFIAATTTAEDSITRQQLDMLYFTVNQAAASMQNALLYRELQSTQEYLQQVIHTVQDTLLSVDREGRVLFANKALAQFGFRPQRFQGRDFSLLLPREEERRQLKELLATQDNGKMEAVLLDSQHRERQVEIIAAGLPRTGPEQEILLLVRDLTETRKLQQQAMEAEKMAALTKAAIAVNHEINNPLTTILGNLFLLKQESEREQQTRMLEKLEIIENNSKRIQEVIRRFDSLAEIKVVKYLGDLEMIDLGDGSDPESSPAP